MDIIWSEPASLDLDNIKKYISNDSKYYADIFLAKLIKSAEKLEQFPEIGRIVPEINKKNIREIIFRPYRIIYKIHNDKIFILTIIHGARLLKKFIKDIDVS